MRLILKIKLAAVGLLALLAIGIWQSGSALPSFPELYDLKRLQEKVFMVLQSNHQAKLRYYQILLGKRLNELERLVERREFDFLLTSSLRYAATAGQMTELIKTNGLVDQVQSTQDLFSAHQKTIKKLVDSYPTDENGDWKYVQDDFNYLAIYSDQLSEN